MNLNPACNEVDNLSCFVHPEYGQSYRLMDKRTVVNLSQELLERIIDSGCKKVLSIDSGSRPLVEIMNQLDTGSGINYRTIKCQRDIAKCQQNLAENILFYLTSDERLLREKEVRKVCGSFLFPEQIAGKIDVGRMIEFLLKPACDLHVAELNRVLAGTELAKFIEDEFILFDEYVTSGTTIANTHLLIKMFNPDARYKLATYFFNDSRTEKPQFLLYSKYFSDDVPAMYEAGVYPFENRIDLIGFFYCIAENRFSLVRNAELCYKPSEAGSGREDDMLLQFFRCAYEDDEFGKMLGCINSCIKYEDTKKYNSKSHLMLYLLYLLEENDARAKEFFMQCFEMHAPAWSPMPLDYHINFVDAYEKNSVMFWEFIKKSNMRESYGAVRDVLLCQAVTVFEERRAEYFKEIDKIIFSVKHTGGEKNG